MIYVEEVHASCGSTTWYNSLEDGLPDLPVILELMQMQHTSAQQLFSALVDLLLKAKEKEQQNHLVPLSIV